MATPAASSSPSNELSLVSSTESLQSTVAPTSTTAAATTTSPTQSSDGQQQQQQQQQQQTPLSQRDGGPLLLREWSDPPVAPAVVVTETPDDDEGNRLVPRLPHFSAYPVANLVRDFVRTGLDQAQMLLPTVATASTTTTTTSNNDHHDAARTTTANAGSNNNLSIRSEPATYAARGNNRDNDSHPYAVSARTVDEMDDEGAEYIIVDGELIAVPSSTVHHHDGHHHHGDHHLDEEDYDYEPPSLRKKACRKGRMQRGFRKVRKFFARKKQPKKEDNLFVSLTSHSGGEDNLVDDDQSQQQQQQEQQLQQAPSFQQQQTQQDDDESIILRGHISPAHSPRSSFRQVNNNNANAAGAPSEAWQLEHDINAVHPVAAAAAAAAKATNFRRQLSLGETSVHSAASTTTSPNRKERRKNKVSWKKQPSPANNAKSNNRRGSYYRKNNKSNNAGAVTEEDDQKPRSKPHPNDTFLQSSTAYGPEPIYPIPPVAAAAAAASATPALPSMVPIQEALDSRGEQSVTASLIGTADEPSVLEAGMVLPAAEAFIEGYYNQEYEEKLKRDDAIPASLVPTDTDYKVDKEHAPDVEAMLRRAEQEAITDLDMADPLSTAPLRRGKTTGVSVPLSQACPADELVHNDSLKVVLVGSAGVDKSSLARAIRQSNKKPRKRTTLGVEVHTWTASDIRFHLWDVQGATQPETNGGSCSSFGSPGGFAERANGLSGNYEAHSTPNFGAHPGTQSLFFSSQSLYLLVWDMACNNPHTHPVVEDDSDDDDDLGGNDWSREEAKKQADRALQEDIENRVLSWVDRIARRGPRSSILPVALIPDGMPGTEAQRRCDRLYELLEARMAWYEGNDRAPNVVLDDSKNILCVNYSQNYGIEQLQETMVAIATDTSSSVFTHVGTPVPPGVVEVLALVKRVKDDHKLIWLDHILGELGSSVPVEDVINALHFLSSIGEILYFGTEEDEVLSQFVVLSRKWLVSAISCILRNDLKRELTETRRFMNMQCIYSEQQFAENDVTRVLASGAASSCPLLCGEDAKMLWQSMSFMREAADRYWQLNESSASAPTMFCFLEHLLVNCGILLPLGMSNYGSAGAGMERDEVYFVPSLLAQNEPGDVSTYKDIWTYRNNDSWTTTLCHSWLFRDGAPSELFEHITVALLKGKASAPSLIY